MKEIIMTRIKAIPGMRHRGLLLYTQNGECNACAVGAFIPPKLEEAVKQTGSQSTEVLGKVPALNSFMPLELPGLQDLMGAHDGAKSDDPRREICDWIDQNVEEAVPV